MLADLASVNLVRVLAISAVISIPMRREKKTRDLIVDICVDSNGDAVYAMGIIAKVQRWLIVNGA